MAGILNLRVKILISLKFIRKYQDCFLLKALLQSEEEIIMENSKHNSAEQNLED